MFQIISFFLFLTIYSSCPANDQRCASCSSNMCQVCYDSYIGQDGKCIVSNTKIDNCLQYITDGQCEQCRHGYRLTQTGRCVEILLQDCDQVDKQGKCEICSYGIKVVNGVCNKDNRCQTQNCSFCTNKNNVEECIRCDDSYVLDNNNVNNNTNINRCIKETSISQNCLYVSVDGRCAICDLNYYQSNGICQKSDVLNLQLYDVEREKGILEKGYNKTKDVVVTGYDKTKDFVTDAYTTTKEFLLGKTLSINMINILLLSIMITIFDA